MKSLLYNAWPSGLFNRTRTKLTSSSQSWQALRPLAQQAAAKPGAGLAEASHNNTMCKAESNPLRSLQPHYTHLHQC